MDRFRQRLREAFDAELQRPAQYRQRVQTECRTFPEGDLFPYALPGYAYAHLALEDRSQRASAPRKLRTLIDLATPVVARRVRAPNGDLRQLDHFNGHAVHLGHLNLLVGSYRRLAADDRYAALHDHLSSLLERALRARDGRPLESLPGTLWSFDTIPCLLSLKLHDEQSGGDRFRPLLQRHLLWLREHGTDPQTGLPFSRGHPRTGKGLEPPRGCELSWRIALLSEMDRRSASEQYRHYTRSFWLDRWGLSGFAEWPHGASVKQDYDSGPIVMGIGSTASAFGIAAARAMNDEPRLAMLIAQMQYVHGALPHVSRRDPRTGRTAVMGMLPYDPRYVTGFLYGDAVLFYALSWPQGPADH